MLNNFFLNIIILPLFNFHRLIVNDPFCLLILKYLITRFIKFRMRFNGFIIKINLLNILIVICLDRVKL